MAIIKIRNPAIDLDAAEIPNIDASKITTGSLGADRIPGLAASKITSGTFDDARIAASNVSQHATSFDDNKIVNDISTLALRQASDANRSAYNTNSQSVDVFQDATGIDTTTNVERNASEYVSSITGSSGRFVDDSYTRCLITFQNSTFVDSSSHNKTLTINSGITRIADGQLGTYGGDFSGASGTWLSFEDSSVGTGDFTMESFIKQNTIGGTDRLFNAGAEDSDNDTTPNGISVGWQETGGSPNTNLNFYGEAGTSNWNATATHPGLGNWFHFVLQRSSGAISAFVNGVQTATDSRYSGNNINGTQMIAARISSNGNTTEEVDGVYDEFRFSNIARYSGNFTPPQNTFVTSATGNFTGTTITAPSSVSSMGAIITYQDNAGTNALNTDIVLQLSADGGSNYSTATLTALPDFSTGIKMAKVNDLAVTAGTSLKYKLSFANQASGSKEARIRGVSLQY
jgi:hypothetical protein